MFSRQAREFFRAPFTVTVKMRLRSAGAKSTLNRAARASQATTHPHCATAGRLPQRDRLAAREGAAFNREPKLEHRQHGPLLRRGDRAMSGACMARESGEMRVPSRE